MSFTLEFLKKEVFFMAEKSRYNEKLNKINQAYIKKSYDDLRIRLRKDAELNKTVVEEEAKKHGESVNAYVLKAIAERIARDSRE